MARRGVRNDASRGEHSERRAESREEWIATERWRRDGVAHKAPRATLLNLTTRLACSQLRAAAERLTLAADTDICTLYTSRSLLVRLERFPTRSCLRQRPLVVPPDGHTMSSVRAFITVYKALHSPAYLCTV